MRYINSLLLLLLLIILLLMAYCSLSKICSISSTLLTLRLSGFETN